MSHYTDFKLYWEVWGGYPERTYPFGNPELIWIIASENSAARCQVFSESKGSMTLQWKAEWDKIEYEVVDRLKNVLEDIGAFDNLKPLVANAAEGDYRSVWDLTGVDGDRTFRFSLTWTTPGEQWTALGERFREIMGLLRN
jgi:hypothetical protein